MGVINGLARLLGAKRAHAYPPHPSDPVAIDISSPESDEERAPSLSPRKLTTETIAELQRNYQEVLTVVRKVNDHLDTQEDRARRLLELAEKNTTSLDAVPAIRDNAADMNSAVRALLDTTREHADRHAHALARQGQAFDDIRTLAARAAEAESRMSQALDGFRDSITAMGESNNGLTRALVDLRKTDMDRERELAKMVERSQRVTVLAVGAVAVMMVITLVVLALAMSG